MDCLLRFISTIVSHTSRTEQFTLYLGKFLRLSATTFREGLGGLEFKTKFSISNGPPTRGPGVKEQLVDFSSHDERVVFT